MIDPDSKATESIDYQRFRNIKTKANLCLNCKGHKAIRKLIKETDTSSRTN
jgi:hypothetical protein